MALVGSVAGSSGTSPVQRTAVLARARFAAAVVAVACVTSEGLPVAAARSFGGDDATRAATPARMDET